MLGALNHSGALSSLPVSRLSNRPVSRLHKKVPREPTLQEDMARVTNAFYRGEEKFHQGELHRPDYNRL